MQLTTRKIVFIGIMGALTIILGVTGIGLVPVPTPAGRATILHVPTIIAAILEGPVVGFFIGLIFGVHSFLTAPSALAKDPFVAILPRLFIGVVAYYAYQLGRKNTFLGSILAAVAGTLTNTVGFLSMAVIQGYLTLKVAGGIAVVHGLPEMVVAVLIVVALVKVLQKN